MKRSSLRHVPDHILSNELAAAAGRHREVIAQILAHMAEVDARRLYASSSYASMVEWCVGEMGMHEDEALERVLAAQVARRFPALFDAVADGRLELCALLLLAPHLTPETADELIAAAAFKDIPELAVLLAQRFARLDPPGQA